MTDSLKPAWTIGIKYFGFVLCLFALFACSSAKDSPDSAVSENDAATAEADASTSDSGIDTTDAADGETSDTNSCRTAPGKLGGLCDQASCAQGLTCVPKQALRVPVRELASGAERTVDFATFPGGACSKSCTVGDDTCGSCGACTALAFIGRYLVPTGPNPTQGFCTLRCDPSLHDRGECSEGMVCTPQGVCLNACTSDEQCRLSAEDPDEDGNSDLFLDPNSTAFCNQETGLCDHPEGEVGQLCQHSSDCGAYSHCLLNTTKDRGVCVREFCGDDYFPCAAQNRCNVRLADLWEVDEEEQNAMCLPGCQIGSESADLRLGPQSHGEGCPEGFACLWDGVSKVDDPINGGCFPTPGHNQITLPNLGTPCDSDDECYSPWGLGYCDFPNDDKSKTGLCAIAECSNYPDGTAFDGILPGVPSDLPICPEATGVCVVENPDDSAPVSTCHKKCSDPSECPTGFACTKAFDQNEELCWYRCQTDSECREGYSCLREADSVPCTGTEGEACRCIENTNSGA